MKIRLDNGALESMGHTAPSSRSLNLLMRAMLSRAILDVTNERVCYRRNGPAHSAKRWMNSKQDQDYIFSFTSVCNYLGVNGKWLKEVIEKEEFKDRKSLLRTTL